MLSDLYHIISDEKTYAHCASCLAYTVTDDTPLPFFLCKYRLTLIRTWMNKYIPSKVWDKVIYPFPNLNGETIGLLGKGYWVIPSRTLQWM